jgi:small GTP-binding protein
MPDDGGRLKTGVHLIDEKLRGGFRRPSTLLFFSTTPTEKRVFAEHFVISGVRNDETCLYVDFFRAPQLARRDFQKFGAFPQDRLVFVDATSSQLLIPSEEPYAIRDLEDFDHITDRIERAIREVRPSRVVIDSMEFLADRFPKPAVFRYWKRLIDVAKDEGAVISFLFINWIYGEEELVRIREMSDYVVEFRFRMRTGILENFLRITETQPKGLETNWIPYTFKDMTGLQVYFPRILVTGPYNAGKSTVVRSLSKNAVSVDRMGTTVSFDYGNVETMGIEAELFGTPGQERFEFIFKIFAREVSGILLVVDATRPEDFPRATQMLDLAGRETPHVVLANKSDLSGALPPEEVHRLMDLPEDIPVVATVATEGRGVREALRKLAEMIVGVG